MTTVYMVRHCESAGNIARRIQGRTDCDISDNGKLQLENLKNRMVTIPLDVIYSSPLKRPLLTANAMKGDRDIEIRILENLQEMSFGIAEDKTWEEIAELLPGVWEEWRTNPYFVRFPDGETFQDVEERTVATVEQIVKANPGKHIAIATHATPVRVFSRFVLDESADLKNVDWARNTSITTVEYSDDFVPKMISYNDFSHQPEDLLYHIKTAR